MEIMIKYLYVRELKRELEELNKWLENFPRDVNSYYHEHIRIKKTNYSKRKQEIEKELENR